MPLLPLEPFVFPETLLTPAWAAAESTDARWWVLHTRPRSEKALARKLLGQALPFFLPTYHRRWQARGRTLASHQPLFPGYMFLFGDGGARRTAVESNLVANALPVVDQQGLIVDLARVRSMIDADLPLLPEERLLPGSRVEIVAGPLSGLEGKVIKRGRQHHFILEVRLLQQGVSVEIETWMFRALDKATVAPAMAGRM